MLFLVPYGLAVLSILVGIAAEDPQAERALFFVSLTLVACGLLTRAIERRSRR